MRNRRRNAATRGHRTLRSAVAAMALVCAIGLVDAAAQTPVTAGYRDFSFGTTGSSTPTGEKPESKLWWNDGVWWGSLYNAGAQRFHIYRFDGATQSWTDTGTPIDDRNNSKADALWDADTGRLYVVSHVFTTNGQTTGSSQWGRLYRYTYDPGQQEYSLDPGFPVTVTRGRSETLTIAKDSVGRLWVTYVESSRVKVNWSRTSDLDWGDPVTLPGTTSATSVGSDDISTVVAFGGAFVGVIWSNQPRNESYFTYRIDTQAPDAWQPIERVLPGTGCSGACSDDHFNVKTDSAGRLFVATKTSLTASQAPLVMLSVRAPGAPGTWVNHEFGTESNHHTRPIVLLHEEANRLYMFATSGESGGTIYLKTSPLDAISFVSGLGTAVIQSATDSRINNVTSTKQNVTNETGILIAASDQVSTRYFHAFLPLGAGPAIPAAPTTLTASAISSSRIDLAWADASDNEDDFRVERAVAGGAFGQIASVGAGVTTFSDTTVSPSTAYSYRVRAHNAGGFSSYSPIADATTPGTVVVPPAAPSGLGGTAVSSTRVDLVWTDNSTNEADFAIERSSSGGAFQAVGTVGANITAFTDHTVSASTEYSYRVKARNAGGDSAYSGTATVTTPAPPTNLPIKAITFEGGALVEASTGAEKITGSVALETAVPLKGSFSARIPNLTATYLEQTFAASTDLYTSFYLRLNALPASDARIFFVSNAGVTVGNIVLRTSGRLRLRVESTTVGSESAALVPGQIYRVGIRQKRGTSGDAVLEAFLASGDAGFGPAFAATAAGAWTTPADRVRFGATTGAVDIVFDDVRLDAASMPGPSQ